MDEDSGGKQNDGINDNCAKPGDAMRCDDSNNECLDVGVNKPSFKDVVAEGNGVKCPPSAAFECSIGEGDHGHRGSNADGLPINISGGKGKAPLLPENTLSLTPNVDMVNAIKGEQSRLKSIAVFFVCMDVKFLPAREYLDDWINNVWGKKLGIVVNFSRMIQKGLFVIFFKNHAMQEKVFF